MNQKKKVIEKKSITTQKAIADKIGISVGKINKIMNDDYPTWLKNNHPGAYE